jgi:hypothetical protein
MITMKKYLLISALAITPAFSDEKVEKPEKGGEEVPGHVEHDHKIKAPNGGRILHEVVPHAEFFITKDRKVQITFVDDEGKPLKDKATVKAVGGKLLSPTKVTFKKTEYGFLSEEELPEGKMVPIMLTFKDSEGKVAPRIKFNVDMSDCPTCDFLEYACICDHGDDHEGHDHEGHDHDEHDKKEEAKK